MPGKRRCINMQNIVRDMKLVIMESQVSFSRCWHLVNHSISQSVSRPNVLMKSHPGGCFFCLFFRFHPSAKVGQPLAAIFVLFRSRDVGTMQAAPPYSIQLMQRYYPSVAQLILTFCGNACAVNYSPRNSQLAP